MNWNWFGDKDNKDVLDRITKLETALNNQFGKILKREDKIIEELEAVGNVVRAIRELIGTAPLPVARVIFNVIKLDPIEFVGQRKGTTPMQLTDTQKSTYTLTGETAEGNPTQLVFDAPPVWSSDNPAIVTVDPAPDGMSCVVGSPAPGPLGSAVISLDGSIKGKPIHATDSIDIVAGDAVKVNLVAGPAEDA